MTVYGYRTTAQYKAETTYAEVAVVADFVQVPGKVKSVDGEPNNNFFRTQGLGEGKDQTATLFANFSYDWSMDIDVSNNFDFLKFGIGTLTESATATGKGTAASPHHIATTLNDDLDTFNLHYNKITQGGTPIVERLVGCVMNTINFKTAIGDPLSVTVDGFAQKPIPIDGAGTTNKPTGGKEDDDLWMYHQGDVIWDAENAVANQRISVIRIQSMELTIDNQFNRDENFALGSRFLLKPIPNERKFDWNVTVKSTLETYNLLVSSVRGLFGQATSGVAGGPISGNAAVSPTLVGLQWKFVGASTTDGKNMRMHLRRNAVDSVSESISIGGGMVEYTITGHGQAAGYGSGSNTNSRFIEFWGNEIA